MQWGEMQVRTMTGAIQKKIANAENKNKNKKKYVQNQIKGGRGTVTVVRKAGRRFFSFVPAVREVGG